MKAITKKQRLGFAAQGKAAFDAGIDYFGNCPFDDGTEQQTWWLYGWWKSYYASEEHKEYVRKYEVNKVLEEATEK